ncbi:MAG: hsp70 family protein [Verrucomicrobiales bacterium]|nr:hsp70 family protein [Verrucomicrobiales bacterium]
METPFSSRYIVGIDLGTSNCALASVDTDLGPEAPVVDFPIPQVQQLGQVEPALTLPSCLYLPAAGEFPEGALSLPWERAPEFVVGRFARAHGARVPGRLVHSAKSWLCHAAVDRSAAILPWGAPEGVPRVSPVEASARYLRHLVQAWDQAHPDHPLAQQEVVLTVPASFDAAARALTVDAARQAGLDHLTRVEEPQAAFEAFTHVHRHHLDRVLEGIRLVVVIDVGGGTTDFTLVEVQPGECGPSLRRLAVGEHLMLGGDNIDAALARRAEERLLGGRRRLSQTQWAQLVHLCREAKETLLAEDGPAEYRITLAGQGSALIGGTLSTRLSADDVAEVALEGFFPRTRSDEGPARASRLALQEVGLPYAQDPAVTRQLAGFLRAHRAVAGAALRATGDLPRPDAVLLNGGVFLARRLASRLIEVASSWWSDAPPIRQLGHESLDLAVARGAVIHGLARRGLARRMTGGSSHAVYVGLERQPDSEPTALCVIARGTEEGQTTDLNQRVLGLTLGRPVQFPLFTSAADRMEAAGEIVPVTEDMRPVAPLHALLKGRQGGSGLIPVHLRATLTELGTLDLWCVANQTDERWRLEFELRGSSGSTSAAVVESLPTRFKDAVAALEQVYGRRGASGSGGGGAPESTPKAAKQLWPGLERILGSREEWRLPVLRELWSTAFAGAARRRRTADHERVFYQIAGYTLRPGFGYPLDDWRCEQAAKWLGENVQFPAEKPVWTEYWVMWRRLAGGLTPARHREIWDLLKPHLVYRVNSARGRVVARPKGVQPEGLDEMVRLAAALEHLPAEERIELGQLLLGALQRPEGVGGPWAWALGRLGARTPIYGSAHHVVEPATASGWLGGLIEAHQRGAEGALFAITQVARLTGDRSRDLDEADRGRALEVLNFSDAPDSWRRMISEVTDLDRADEARALGDTLPVGLRA